MTYQPRPIRTLQDAKQRNAWADMHFFSKGAMRFFSSRVSDRIYPLVDGGALFVTSERFDERSRRLYTVTVIAIDGKTDRVSEFQQHRTSKEAHRWAKALQTAYVGPCDPSPAPVSA